MKKKGLIISTVVMVVVLIASLTTATYAWFTAVNSVQVSPINLVVKSNASVNVGVRHSEGVGYDYYYYNTLTVPEDATGNQVKWNSDDIGMGSTLVFKNLDLSTGYAIGTSTGDSDWVGGTSTVDAKTDILNTTKTIIKAQGSGTTVDKSTVAVANANKDYLDATIGVEANQADIKGTYVKVVVKTTDSNVTLGVSASIHFVIVAPDGKKIEFEPFGENANTAIKKNLTASQKSGTITVEGTQAVSTFYFWVAKSEGAALGLNGSEIRDFRILAYIDGADPHCVKDAKGGSTIEISFAGTKDLTKLDDEMTLVSSVKFLTFA